jgi:hypothetical protein
MNNGIRNLEWEGGRKRKRKKKKYWVARDSLFAGHLWATGRREATGQFPHHTRKNRVTLIHLILVLKKRNKTVCLGERRKCGALVDIRLCNQGVFFDDRSNLNSYDIPIPVFIYLFFVLKIPPYGKFFILLSIGVDHNFNVLKEKKYCSTRT